MLLLQQPQYQQQTNLKSHLYQILFMDLTRITF